MGCEPRVDLAGPVERGGGRCRSGRVCVSGVAGGLQARDVALYRRTPRQGVGVGLMGLPRGFASRVCRSGGLGNATVEIGRRCPLRFERR